ncbi:MAG: DNA repair exonuclease [Candidatus Cloacimonetes bacterium]|nr:DNA repair exonuclease [Candidatus Cloacimonadota bacterium]
MIKLTFLSDTHLGFDLPLRTRVQKRRRGEDFFTNTRQVLEQAIAGKSDLIIHGGDLFFRSKIPAQIIDKVYTLLFEYADRGIPIIIVPGNHERSVLPQSILLNHPNLYVFQQAESFEFIIRGEKIIISGFPNIRHEVRAKFVDIQAGLQIKKQNLNILVMHQAIDGSQIVGYTFRATPDVVNIHEIDNRYDLVLSGHIHRRQILTNGMQPIIYSGSVERTSFQEMSEPKGYYEIEMVKKNTGWRADKITFLELNTRPMVDIYLDEIIDKINWQMLLSDELKKLAEDSIVRLKMQNKTGKFDCSRLTAEKLRVIFPDTMNYTLSRSLFAVKQEQE